VQSFAALSQPPKEIPAQTGARSTKTAEHAMASAAAAFRQRRVPPEHAREQSSHPGNVSNGRGVLVAGLQAVVPEEII
jgi:hypothetical protein